MNEPYTFTRDAGREVPIEETEVQDDNGVFTLNLSRFDVHAWDIRARMAFHYGCVPADRQFHGVPVFNQYGEIGSAFFSLHGSPPKGYAITFATRAGFTSTGRTGSGMPNGVGS